MIAGTTPARTAQHAGLVGEESRLSRTNFLRGAIAIARIEAKRLARHPAVLIMGILGLLPLLTFTDPAEPLGFTMIDLGLALWGLAGGTMIASNLAVRRPIRDDSLDFYESMPLHNGARTVGHLLAVVVPVFYGVVGAVAVVVLRSVRGAEGSIDLLEAATGPLLVAGGGALGVLTGRWIPTTFGWLAGMIAVLTAQVTIGGIEPESDPLRTLGPVSLRDQFIPAELLLRDAGWHLVYLTGLIWFAATVAIARSGLGRRTIAFGLASIALASGGAVAQMQPPSDAEAARLAAIASAVPASCLDQGVLDACVFPGDEGPASSWLAVARSVLLRAPEQVRARRLILEQRYGTSTMRALPAEVHARLLPGLPSAEPFVWPDTGVVRVDRRGDPDPTAIALRVGMWAVGMPLEPGARIATPDDEQRLLRNPLRMGAEPPVRAGTPVMLRCVAHGQARAVIALWLTLHDQDALKVLSLGLPGNDPSDGLVDARPEVRAIPFDADELLFIEPPTWGSDMPAPALFAVSDLRYAYAMLDLPIDDVMEHLQRHWLSLTDPATPTARLVELLALDALPADAHQLPFEPVEPSCA